MALTPLTGAPFEYVSKAGDMLDALCWQMYGQQEGAVEFVLRRNPSVAQHQPHLPAGVLIRFWPITRTYARTVRLYD